MKYYLRDDVDGFSPYFFKIDSKTQTAWLYDPEFDATWSKVNYNTSTRAIAYGLKKGKYKETTKKEMFQYFL